MDSGRLEHHLRQHWDEGASGKQSHRAEGVPGPALSSQHLAAPSVPPSNTVEAGAVAISTSQMRS